MIVFVDTSAFYAGLDQDDINHKRAKNAWTDLLAGDAKGCSIGMLCPCWRWTGSPSNGTSRVSKRCSPPRAGS